MIRRSGSGLFVLVLAVTLMHALAQARLRPLYQISDEMAYLRAAQLVALAETNPAEHRCIAPPQGQPFELGAGGKVGFRHVVGWQLAAVCSEDTQTLPLFALRAVQALSLPVLAALAAYLSWLVSGSREAGLLAALLVGIHPVATKYAGGVTPDAWTNVFGALMVVVLSRVTLGVHRWWDLWIGAACAFAGLLWKETANMLAPLAVLVVLMAAAQRWRRGGPHGGSGPAIRNPRGTAAAGLAALAVSLWVVRRMWSALVATYAGADHGRLLLARPFAFAAAVWEDLTAHVPGVLASSILSLYRPLVYGPGAGQGQPVTPETVVVIIVGLYAAGLVLGVLHGVAPARGMRPVPARVYAVWALTGMLALAQPSVRQVLLDASDLYQGRWLFPALAPAAALAGVGLARLPARGFQVVPLVVLAGIASIWLVLLDIVRHHYVVFPTRLVRGSLFLRPTGEADAGDAQVLALIEGTLTAQEATWTWGILVLLGVASLWLAVSVIRHASSPARHG